MTTYKFPPTGTIISMDFETAGLDDYKPLIVSYAWYSPETRGYVSLAVDLRKDPGFISKVHWMLDVCQLAVFHYYKFDFRVLEFTGYDVRKLENRVTDTSLLGKLHPHGAQDASLKNLAELVGDEKGDYKASSALDGEAFLEYAAKDAELTLRLFFFLYGYFKEKDMLEVMTLETGVGFVTYVMERNGIGFNLRSAHIAQAEITSDIDATDKEIAMLLGTPINVNSSKQLGKLLFEDFKLPVVYRTPKGGASTDAAALKALVTIPDLPASIRTFLEATLKFKGLSKIHNTYLSEKMFGCVEGDGRIHATFNSLGAETGRFSSASPNLQNIPSGEHKYGAVLRRLFEAPEGKVFISVDYSQIELRMLAHYTRDKKMMEAFRSGLDLHDAVARTLGIPRKFAKTINFGIAYGQGAAALADGLKISVAEATEYLTDFYATYKAIKVWKEQVIAYASMHGGVRTMAGRFRDLRRWLKFEDGGFERRAVNTVIQGSSADIMKFAMLKTFRRFKNDRVKMLLQVHDEFLFETDQEYAEEASLAVKDIMENIVPLEVPLVAEPHIAQNWLDAKA